MAKPKVFISYSVKDITWTRQFVDALTTFDIEVWFDAYRVPAGKPFQAEMEKAFRSSDYIALLLTEDTAQMPEIYFTIGATAGTEKLIPIVPKDMNMALVPPPLRQKQLLIRTSPRETAKRLAAQLKSQSSAASVPSHASTRG